RKTRIDVRYESQQFVASQTSGRRGQETWRRLFKPAQELFLKFRHIDVGLLPRVLVRLRKYQDKGDPLFAQPAAKFDVDVLWFVTAVNQHEHALQICARDRVSANKLLPARSARLGGFRKSVSGKIDQKPGIVNQKMVNQLRFSRRLGRLCQVLLPGHRVNQR